MATHSGVRLSLETLGERTLPAAGVLNPGSHAAEVRAEHSDAPEAGGEKRQNFAQFVRLSEKGIEVPPLARLTTEVPPVTPPVTPPAPTPTTGTSSLSGSVFVDAFQDYQESGVASPDVMLNDVTVTLSRLQDGQWVGVATTTTADGVYSFGNLAAGTYQITQTQPESYNGQPLEDAADYVGSLGGDSALNDIVSGIAVGDGQHGTNYNFTETIASS